MGVGESMEARCARYKAERDCARQELAARRVNDAKDEEAARWVRKQGGLDRVREAVDFFEGMHDGLYTIDATERHTGDEMIREVFGWCKRLMPESCEWPCYEDDEPFVPGDDGSVEFFGDGIVNVWINGDHQHLTRGERVKRPAPKVVDADGVEIRVGDTVWHVETGDEYIVRALPKPGEYQAVELTFIHGASAAYDPCLLTHRAPVLAADGKPLREGETVYEAGTGDEFLVQQIYGGTTELDFPDHTVRCSKPGDCATHMFSPEQLTHERPDSWELWREEWQWPPVKYCKLILGVEYDHDTQLQEAFDAQGEDLVRRAKALAERGK